MYEYVCGERQNDLGPRQLTQYSGNKVQPDLCKSSLVQQKDCATSPWLAAMNLGDNGVRLVFESIAADNDPFIV